MRHAHGVAGERKGSKREGKKAEGSENKVVKRRT